MSGRPQGPHIEVSGLTKRYGAVRAVDDLSFTVRPGVVTGFLGPNGAGKTTTMRMILGLVTPTAGTATIGGKRYAELSRPSATVGAVLDASAVHPGHTARDHLHIYRTMGGHPAGRVDELLTRLGLAQAADRRTRTFSTGMRQRLGLATALLGDPRVLLLDEPSNGLDPEGIAWLRGLLRELAAEGRTVLVSSHVLSEVQQVVEDVVVIRAGRLVAAGPLAEIERSSPGTVLVRSPDAAALRAALLRGTARGGAADRVDLMPDGTLCVYGMADSAVADLAAAERLRIHGLTAGAGLEQLFLRLAGDDGPAGGDGPPVRANEKADR
ncbi:ATP-binding cassette domain-containing protein [Streptomyces sp. NBC_01591]|uniref:ABC transporter ATP-binding protein n=1 Tax=Streptomyces sp. NBC_01591 TaxID=2975888 RepID=UPI002DDB646B|nr:ATP-binding cassette domain-containing protein [Streptomyces sp. NBC_01591]WSD71523.1 ATP-binding cassette domain-containing protein [Streptomyces sp. NBC_01591]